ncbi:carbohydrate ABC transporter permease [Sulfoacidibacillus thermotolerans]|nr:sugar ABC transporter permease [Sulfoacidibacillus thermotolerans]
MSANMANLNRIANNKSVKKGSKTQKIAYLYMSPALITIAVLGIAPILYTIFIAFTDYNQMHFLNYHFVGLKNFISLLNPNNPLSAVFIPTFVWTLVYALLTTGFAYFIGLFLAVLLNNPHLREGIIYRTILIIPWAVPGMITMLVWQGLLNDSYGQINALLHTVGIPKIPWQSSPFWARFSVIMVNVWAGFPYMMTVCLGALQAIPSEIYEAAAIDGANWWQKFRWITIREIWSITLPLVIPSFAFNFNNFGGVYLLTGGGPARSDNPFVGQTDILASAAYKMTLDFNRYDLASAISIILFVIVGVISWLNMRYTGAFKEVE